MKLIDRSYTLTITESEAATIQRALDDREKSLKCQIEDARGDDTADMGEIAYLIKERADARVLAETIGLRNTWI